MLAACCFVWCPRRYPAVTASALCITWGLFLNTFCCVFLARALSAVQSREFLGTMGFQVITALNTAQQLPTELPSPRPGSPASSFPTIHIRQNCRCCRPTATNWTHSALGNFNTTAAGAIYTHSCILPQLLARHPPPVLQLPNAAPLRNPRHHHHNNNN